MTKTVSIYHYHCSECHGWIWCSLVVSWHQRSPKPFLNGADIMEMLSRGPSHLIFLVVPENIESNCWSSLNLPSTIFQKDLDVFRRKPCVLSGPFSATWPHSTVLLESVHGEGKWVECLACCSEAWIPLPALPPHSWELCGKSFNSSRI